MLRLELAWCSDVEKPGARVAVPQANEISGLKQERCGGRHRRGRGDTLLFNQSVDYRCCSLLSTHPWRFEGKQARRIAAGSRVGPDTSPESVSAKPAHGVRGRLTDRQASAVHSPITVDASMARHGPQRTDGSGGPGAYRWFGTVVSIPG